MLNVVIPNDRTRIIKTIEALKWQVERDTNDKDREIHLQAIKDLEKALEQ